ncbi:inositol monophosphatase family protein [Nocardia sp. CDC159]|uniref:Inositol monophosphatase family protein n=1 Tax=Nocardia pulmonis TaxID=2951408 RepID=A0A9X2E3X1_9NOCA|nr:MULTISPECIES: inositol monophosphatase family protein [Nocardia]MCM6773832.1 inositol monophosphatase family protein [Nocardia pulmonis]MCM6786719.1 inositol monophosphatase family protein [Nocardia sp. CDC159]
MDSVASLWDELDEQLLPLLRGYRRNLSGLRVDTKSDRTLLSEADVAAQTVIVEAVRRRFPDAGFVAEEDHSGLVTSGDPLWIIDPIDGTSEFVRADGREFCSVVCRVDAGIPTATYILAPELGIGRSALSIRWADEVTVNGRAAVPLPRVPVPRRASVTRSKGSTPRRFEFALTAAGAEVKLRTTSQTLDMVRTCIDLSDCTDIVGSFDLFYRPNQKVWDGAAGIGLSLATGRSAVDGFGTDAVPFDEALWKQREPLFSETIIGSPECVRWFVDVLARSRSG